MPRLHTNPPKSHHYGHSHLAAFENLQKVALPLTSTAAPSLAIAESGGNGDGVSHGPSTSHLQFPTSLALQQTAAATAAPLTTHISSSLTPAMMRLECNTANAMMSAAAVTTTTTTTTPSATVDREGEEDLMALFPQHQQLEQQQQRCGSTSRLLSHGQPLHRPPSSLLGGLEDEDADDEEEILMAPSLTAVNVAPPAMMVAPPLPPSAPFPLPVRASENSGKASQCQKKSDGAMANSDDRCRQPSCVLIVTEDNGFDDSNDCLHRHHQTTTTRSTTRTSYHFPLGDGFGGSASGGGRESGSIAGDTCCADDDDDDDGAANNRTSNSITRKALRPDHSNHHHAINDVKVTPVSPSQVQILKRKEKGNADEAEAGVEDDDEECRSAGAAHAQRFIGSGAKSRRGGGEKRERSCAVLKRSTDDDKHTDDAAAAKALPHHHHSSSLPPPPLVTVVQRLPPYSDLSKLACSLTMKRQLASLVPVACLLGKRSDRQYSCGVAITDSKGGDAVAQSAAAVGPSFFDDMDLFVYCIASMISQLVDSTSSSLSSPREIDDAVCGLLMLLPPSQCPPVAKAFSARCVGAKVGGGGGSVKGDGDHDSVAAAAECFMETVLETTRGGRGGNTEGEEEDTPKTVTRHRFPIFQQFETFLSLMRFDLIEKEIILTFAPTPQAANELRSGGGGTPRLQRSDGQKGSTIHFASPSALLSSRSPVHTHKAAGNSPCLVFHQSSNGKAVMRSCGASPIAISNNIGTNTTTAPRTVSNTSPIHPIYKKSADATNATTTNSGTAVATSITTTAHSHGRAAELRRVLASLRSIFTTSVWDMLAAHSPHTAEAVVGCLQRRLLRNAEEGEGCGGDGDIEKQQKSAIKFGTSPTASAPINISSASSALPSFFSTPSLVPTAQLLASRCPQLRMGITYSVYKYLSRDVLLKHLLSSVRVGMLRGQQHITAAANVNTTNPNTPLSSLLSGPVLLPLTLGNNNNNSPSSSSFNSSDSFPLLQHCAASMLHCLVGGSSAFSTLFSHTTLCEREVLGIVKAGLEGIASEAIEVGLSCDHSGLLSSRHPASSSSFFSPTALATLAIVCVWMAVMANNNNTNNSSPHSGNNHQHNNTHSTACTSSSSAVTHQRLVSMLRPLANSVLLQTAQQRGRGSSSSFSSVVVGEGGGGGAVDHHPLSILLWALETAVDRIEIADETDAAAAGCAPLPLRQGSPPSILPALSRTFAAVREGLPLPENMAIGYGNGSSSRALGGSVGAPLAVAGGAGQPSTPRRGGGGGQGLSPTSATSSPMRWTFMYSPSPRTTRNGHANTSSSASSLQLCTMGSGVGIGNGFNQSVHTTTRLRSALMG